MEYPIPFDEVFDAARLAMVDDLRFRVSSVEHLIRAKRAVHPVRDTDEFDLRHLERMIQREPGPQ